jgi:amino acid permease
MGTYGAALNYVKSTVGIGIFALPLAVRDSGKTLKKKKKKKKKQKK